MRGLVSMQSMGRSPSQAPSTQVRVTASRLPVSVLQAMVQVSFSGCHAWHIGPCSTAMKLPSRSESASLLQLEPARAQPNAIAATTSVINRRRSTIFVPEGGWLIMARM